MLGPERFEESDRSVKRNRRQIDEDKSLNSRPERSKATRSPRSYKIVGGTQYGQIFTFADIAVTAGRIPVSRLEEAAQRVRDALRLSAVVRGDVIGSGQHDGGRVGQHAAEPVQGTA
jgi:hypothetical protein